MANGFLELRLGRDRPPPDRPARRPGQAPSRHTSGRTPSSLACRVRRTSHSIERTPARRPCTSRAITLAGPWIFVPGQRLAPLGHCLAPWRPVLLRFGAFAIVIVEILQRRNASTRSLTQATRSSARSCATSMSMPRCATAASSGTTRAESAPRTGHRPRRTPRSPPVTGWRSPSACTIRAFCRPVIIPPPLNCCEMNSSCVLIVRRAACRRGRPVGTRRRRSPCRRSDRRQTSIRSSTTETGSTSSPVPVTVHCGAGGSARRWRVRRGDLTPRRLDICRGWGACRLCLLPYGQAGADRGLAAVLVRRGVQIDDTAAEALGADRRVDVDRLRCVSCRAGATNRPDRR